MWLIFACLIGGVALGASGRLPEPWLKHTEKLTMLTLFIMLTALGAQVGANAELIANLPVLGWRAFLIAIMAVVGSVSVLWLIERYLLRRDEV